MHYHRLSVSCKFCGQPIVLLETEPARVSALKTRHSIRLRCMSCRLRGIYRLDAFRTFKTLEPSSGDWVMVAHPRPAESGSP